MYWLRIDVSTSREAVEALSPVMLSLSPSGIQIDEMNDTVILTIYLPNSSSLEDAQATIRSALDRISLQGLNAKPANIIVSSISDQDWVENYKRYFTSIRIGRFLIKPSWEDIEIAPDEILIELDPGLAFGTGAHPTTEGCLLFLQEFLIPGEIVFDLGTGSGILAIAAAKLGAKKNVAIDNDEQAIIVARENAQRNGVSSAIEFRAIDFAQMEPVDVDLLVSNLTAPLIISFLPIIAQKFRGVKLFIASGITSAQREDILTALGGNGFTVEKILEKGEWVTVVSTFG